MPIIIAIRRGIPSTASETTFSRVCCEQHPSAACEIPPLVGMTIQKRFCHADYDG